MSEAQDALREGVAAVHLQAIVYATGVLRLTAERLEWEPFPFLQWFWRLSAMVVRTPVPTPVAVDLSKITYVERGERLPIGAGPFLKRPLLVKLDGQTLSFYIGVTVFDEAADWLDDLRGILGAPET